ncbi:MAG TPA: GAF domain-containing sensor histidine kinase [Nocardioidaceae bacterium]|nr:GAF domain-containing sensor histidine kinase [Nocardioidaceae bacterium]
MADDSPPERRDWDDALGFTSLSRVRLDTLLQELLDRVGEVTATQERLRALLDAVVDLSTDLDLDRVLSRITVAACELAGARYGAVGVMGQGDMLAQFITHGIDDDNRSRIGPPPRGHGVLGLLIAEPHPIRLPHIGDHPQSYGFPSNHPPMDSFLGVPIRVHDRVYGNLYLSEKIDGDEFTEQDEQIVVALAAAAGVAIDNARLYELTERRRQWLQATTEISHVLLGRVDREEALQLIARKTREVSACDVAAVLLEDDGSDLVIEVVDGDDMDSAVGLRMPIRDDGLLSGVLRHGYPIVVDDLAEEAKNGNTDLPSEVVDDLAYTLLVPLSAPDGGSGVLLVSLARDSQRPEGFFDVELIATFANQTALALERVRAQEDRALVAVLEDRDRIARDLHDLVIQRLFATGLQLQSMSRLAKRPEIQERITALTDDLDTTIRDIRATIFELQFRPDRNDVRADIRGLAKEYVSTFGFAPRVDLRGPVDSAIPSVVRPQLMAVIREALSNAARHAKASAVEVSVTVAGRELLSVVTDNGIGIGEIRRESGLRNIRERARHLGGSFALRSNDPQGTIVEWRVPLE